MALQDVGNGVELGAHKIGKPYKVGGKWYTPSHDTDYSEVGMASWYGPGFHGKRTANGERFNQNAMTAAHTTLPLPSFVRVTNLNNDKTIVVRVNDRGPFSRNRIIDLSKEAASQLGFIHNGHARVRVDYLGLAPIGGGEKETAVAAKTYATKSNTKLAKANTKPAKATTKTKAAPQQTSTRTAAASGGFFGFGRAKTQKKPADETNVDVRLASITPRTNDEKIAAAREPKPTNLPGVRDEGVVAPVRVAGLPGGNTVAPPKGAPLLAGEPVSPTSPAYAAVRKDGGSVSAPVRVTEQEEAHAYSGPTRTTGAIDALIAMEEKGPPPDLPEPNLAADGRFEGAHDLFAPTGSGTLYAPTGQ